MTVPRWAAACVLSATLACHVASSPPRPDDLCVKSCVATASRCSEVACTRGCQLALDRLVEHEGDRVLACVRKSEATCDDALWAACAAHIGPFLDGGPPAPAAGARR